MVTFATFKTSFDIDYDDICILLRFTRADQFGEK